MAKEVAKGIAGDQERCLQATCSLCFREEESGGLHLCHCSRSPPCWGVGVDVCASWVLSVSDEEHGPPCALQGQEEDRESQDPSPSASREKNILKTTSKEVLSVVHGKPRVSLNGDSGADR
ncbi:polycystic kidney disease protein 1-like 1 [Nycticebus coucang]|uniref:polycystic kidney disease protein 1-like 1 n=1 Tax=Nycticebus coucang TaxID=9470 RepID=UPI00234E3129|nr:polycystic kidney disease protein 1-like 1 [Nycticebus coucang]